MSGDSASRVADDADPDVVGVQIGEIVADEALQEAHEVGHLLRRPAPVLGREAVDREIADAELDRRADGAPHRLDAAAMALDPGQAAPRRPAAVAVHDDRHMGRHGFAACAGRDGVRSSDPS